MVLLLGVGRWGLGPLAGIGALIGPAPPKGGTERTRLIRSTPGATSWRAERPAASLQLLPRIHAQLPPRIHAGRPRKTQEERSDADGLSIAHCICLSSPSFVVGGPTWGWYFGTTVHLCR